MKYVITRGNSNPDRSIILAALRAVDSPPRPYSYVADMKAFNCFNNVEEVVASKGGRAVMGWSMLNLKFAMEQAASLQGNKRLGKIRGWDIETHCVWENAQGELIDVTPTEGASRCKFVPDVTLPYGYTLSLTLFKTKEDRAVYHDLADRAPDIFLFDI